MPTLVIIDDEESVCGLIKKLFVTEGYEVKYATDPIKGLDLVAQENPDCVLLDIKMPRMDGIEALQKIKEIDSGIGVIMITGYGNLESAIESMKIGAFDYITKPFDLDFLKELVHKCLQENKT